MIRKTWDEFLSEEKYDIYSSIEYLYQELHRADQVHLTNGDVDFKEFLRVAIRRTLNEIVKGDDPKKFKEHVVLNFIIICAEHHVTAPEIHEFLWDLRDEE